MSVWTEFWDMHSGGGVKEAPYDKIYIEAPEAEAKVIFYNRFGHNPDRVTCTCCGEDYTTDESPTLAAATGYHRNCQSLETPRGEDGGYDKPDDPWFTEHYYIEPGEEAEAVARGYEVNTSWPRYRPHMTVEEYEALPTVLVIHEGDIKPEERTGAVPESGYVWVD